MHRYYLLLIIGCALLLGACTSSPQSNTPIPQNTTIPPVPTLDSGHGSQSDSVVIQETAVPPVPTSDAKLVSRGEEVYQQFCASCHGANLEGQPDWRSPLPDGSFRAPPHDSTGHTWHHPDDLLLEIIAEGSDPAFGGTMQGFADVIEEQDRVAVLEFIKSQWGQEEREFQWWITAR